MPEKVSWNTGTWHDAKAVVPDRGRIVIAWLEHQTEPAVMCGYELADYRPVSDAEAVWFVGRESLVEKERWGWHIIAWHDLPAPPAFAANSRQSPAAVER
jgi:hypothetical protein